jgi:hypothetical protein
MAYSGVLRCALLCSATLHDLRDPVIAHQAQEKDRRCRRTPLLRNSLLPLADIVGLKQFTMEVECRQLEEVTQPVLTKPRARRFRAWAA